MIGSIKSSHILISLISSFVVFLLLISGCTVGTLYYLAVDRVEKPEEITEPFINLTRTDVAHVSRLVAAFDNLNANESRFQVIISHLTVEEQEQIVQLLFQDLGSTIDLDEISGLPRYVYFENLYTKIMFGRVV